MAKKSGNFPRKNGKFSYFPEIDFQEALCIQTIWVQISYITFTLVSNIIIQIVIIYSQFESEMEKSVARRDIEISLFCMHTHFATFCYAYNYESVSLCFYNPALALTDNQCTVLKYY